MTTAASAQQDSAVRVSMSWSGASRTTTFTGADRAAVLEAALAFFTKADEWLRDPTYPKTYEAANGEWQACVTVWNA